MSKLQCSFAALIVYVISELIYLPICDYIYSILHRSAVSFFLDGDELIERMVMAKPPKSVSHHIVVSSS